VRQKYGGYGVKVFQGDWMGLLEEHLVVAVEGLRIESAGGKQRAIGTGKITPRGEEALQQLG
jgi:hypothetical protein